MDHDKLTEITADIVSAHVSNNSVAVNDLSSLIQHVYSALAGLEQGAAANQNSRTPVVTAKASVKPEYIICMECGQKQKTLKRHLQTAHGMDPQTYRKQHGLPHTYPMTAPKYSERRKAIAQTMGLGQKRDPQTTQSRQSTKRKPKRSTISK